MDIRDFIREYLPDSFAIQAIRASVREMEELRGSLLASNLVQQAFEDHQRYSKLITPLNEEIRALAGEANSVIQLAASGSVSLDTASVVSVARQLSFSTESYFSSLASRFAAQNAVLGGLAGLPEPGEFTTLISGLGAGAEFLGEFSYELPDTEEAGEGTNPESVESKIESRLIEVNWFPVMLFEELRRNPELMKGLDDRKFEEFCAELLDRIGFEKVQLTPRSGDGGRDVIAIKTIHGIPILLAFECKRFKESRKIGLGIMRSLLGSVVHRNTMVNKGVLLTTSSFTAPSKTFIAQEPRVDGRDFAGLVEWIKSTSPRK